ncbi:GTP-binding protein [Streptomyces caniscabiei]|uniref:CobW family GTP-binding protein n=1 Tax=Streptomyces caniscabiei TaxID=2746961 RepID=UPI0023DC4ED2|nr:GTP-binding protein [Streptomyces caniscabiei]MDX3513801.1 GTP-binding protein [Streptomyces caniscabiei]MDX3722803.1 GTP-binding protein [Streptomyces caniscabiei]WEO23667.1 GTP-binding protein [Streptomyces caniscabiei]
MSQSSSRGQGPSPQHAPQIPVVVLAGFLGSGKTTLLNHLLHRSGGSRIGAVVNDFGAIEIDAMAVAGALGDSTVSLGNGCLCCAVDVEELDRFLERLADPATGIDVIVIEASGLAEPQELVRMVLASENPRVVYGGLVEVVDAAEFTRTRQLHPELDRHLALADLVVVNKLDRAEDGAGVLALVRSLSDRAAVVPATYGRIDPEFLFDCRPSEERIGQLSFDDLHRHDEAGEEHGDHAGHLHTGYDSVSFVSDVPIDPRRLMEFLDGRAEGLYRIKGYVDFGPYDPRNRYAVHAVGRFLRFYPEPWTPGEASRLTQLVLIGAGIDVPALTKELDACRSEKDAPHTDEHGMWGVLRYVRRTESETGSGTETGLETDIVTETDIEFGEPDVTYDTDDDV